MKLLQNLNRRLFIKSVAAIAGNFVLIKKSIGMNKFIPDKSAAECIVRPRQTEGPYFLDSMLNRSDIRIEPSDNSIKEGIPLNLEFHVSYTAEDECKPLADAIVDVWQCDALGVYSGVVDSQFDTRGKTFLRGYQITDSEGIAKFVTIYPGWYTSRSVHIHFKIRTNNLGQDYEFTSQLYFDDTLSDEIFQNEPYVSKGNRNVRNRQDGIFQNGGDQLIVQIIKNENDYTGIFSISLQINPQTGIERSNDKLPSGFKLGQNFPNPFNGTTAIQFSIPESTYLTMKIYDIFGKEVNQLLKGNFLPGEYKVTWNANHLASGVYFCHLESGSYSETRKLVLQK